MRFLNTVMTFLLKATAAAAPKTTTTTASIATVTTTQILYQDFNLENVQYETTCAKRRDFYLKF